MIVNESLLLVNPLVKSKDNTSEVFAGIEGDHVIDSDPESTDEEAEEEKEEKDKESAKLGDSVYNTLFRSKTQDGSAGERAGRRHLPAAQQSKRRRPGPAAPCNLPAAQLHTCVRRLSLRLPPPGALSI